MTNEYLKKHDMTFDEWFEKNYRTEPGRVQPIFKAALKRAFEAGAAASEARIKALQERVAELERRTTVDGLRCEIGEDGKTMKITIPGRTLLAPLKEADQ